MNQPQEPRHTPTAENVREVLALMSQYNIGIAELETYGALESIRDNAGEGEPELTKSVDEVFDALIEAGKRIDMVEEMPDLYTEMIEDGREMLRNLGLLEKDPEESA